MQKEKQNRIFNESDLLRQLIKEEVERNFLYEGLIYSYPPTFIFPRLKNLGFYDVIYGKNNVFNINFVLDNNNKGRYDELNNFMDNICGWKHGTTKSSDFIIPNKLDFLNLL